MGIKKSKRGEIVLDRHACQVPTGGACASFEDWSVEEQEWLDILLALEERRQPDKVVLARHLRSPKFVVEQPVLDYLADHLEGKTRKRLGRPRTETIEQIRRNFIVRIVHGRARRDAREMPRSKRSRSTPSELALEETVKVLSTEKNIHISAGLVKKIVFPKGSPELPDSAV